MNQNTSKSGIGVLGVLAIVFIVLKLIDVIQWSWVWVLAPIWIPFVAVFAVIVFLGAYAALMATTVKKGTR